MTQKGHIKDGVKKKKGENKREQEKWKEIENGVNHACSQYSMQPPLPSSLLIASQRHRIKQRVICRNWYCSLFPAFPLPFSIPPPPYRTLTPLFFPLSYPILLFSSPILPSRIE